MTKNGSSRLLVCTSLQKTELRSLENGLPGLPESLICPKNQPKLAKTCPKIDFNCGRSIVGMQAPFQSWVVNCLALSNSRQWKRRTCIGIVNYVVQYHISILIQGPKEIQCNAFEKGSFWYVGRFVSICTPSKIPILGKRLGDSWLSVLPDQLAVAIWSCWKQTIAPMKIYC